MFFSFVAPRAQMCSTTSTRNRSRGAWTLQRLVRGTSGTSLESRSSCPNAAGRHHEAKPKPEDCGNQVGALTERVIQGKQDYKARLVVQGCQEDKGYIRTDALTGSRDAFFMSLAAAAQDGWDHNVFDARSASLQSDGIERLLLLRMPHKISVSWDDARASVSSNVQSSGLEMLDVLGTNTVRQCSKPLGSWSPG